MPLSEESVGQVRQRVMYMFLDTVKTFEVIDEHAAAIYGDRASEIKAAINEYFDDFLRAPNNSGETHPEVLIYETTREQFQRAGLYGAQLDIKERQVSTANATLRERITRGTRKFLNKPFRKWVDIINNFLGSLASATGVGEALREIKDCLRDELPDDDE